jgi:L-rhamnose isomerase
MEGTAMVSEKDINTAYEAARERYAEHDVETDEALRVLARQPISLHCWQGDDVGGFEKPGAALSGGGLQVTGNRPGKARNVAELRADLDAAFSLIPGNHRLNLHAIYGEFGKKTVERNAIGPEHFEGWIDWARDRKLGLDFNATCFSHPMADDGFTLSSRYGDTRKFWIEHVGCCREIAAAMGRALGSACLHNLWIPDGSKDLPADRLIHRSLLKDSLDEIYAKAYSPTEMKDSLESKLFGIGSEAYVVGSHEFYLGYALTNKKIVCLDTGHFHPTESVADKISALLPFFDEILLHLSRGVRWDSDHVVIVNDDVRHLAEEIVRSRALDRVHIALDFFDASINRIGAWVIGARAVQKALLIALLEPEDRLTGCEIGGDGFGRLALWEEFKTMPFGAVWDRFCIEAGVPVGDAWMDAARNYEADAAAKRK